MDLTPKQKETLVGYLDLAKYENGTYVFGPTNRKDAQELYEILNIVGSGHDASYIDRSAVNDDKAPILVYVRFSQATRLLKVVSELTGKSLSDLTGGTYTPQVPKEPSLVPTLSVVKPPKKRGRPKVVKEKQLEGFNLDFDFSDMLKQ